jgi:predicted nucleotidyltransferase
MTRPLTRFADVVHLYTNRPVGLFEFIRLKLYLEDLTGRSVDLVTQDAIRPAMRADILNEAVHVA